MYRWFIALRYMSSRITTFAALMVVALSVGLLIVIVSVMEGFRSELVGRIRGTSSDLKVEGTRYIDLRDPDKVAATIQTAAGVRATAPYVEVMTLFRADREYRSPAEFEQRLLRVVDVDRELEVSDLGEYIQAVGIPALPTDPKVLFSRQWNEVDIWKLVPRHRDSVGKPVPPPVIVGKEAGRRDLYPGDTIELTAFSPTTQGPVTRKFQVAGYFKTGLYELDWSGILMERAVAKDFLSLEAPDGSEVVSGIRVAVAPGLEDESSLRDVRRRIDAALEAAQVPFVRTLTWREEKASLLNAVRVEKSLVSLILGMIVLFTGFMIFTILTLQVVEKTRDMGVLQSLGATPAGVAGIFRSIGLVICAAGTLVGAAWGVGFASSVNTIQRWLKLLVGLEVFPQKVYYLERIPVRFDAVDLLTIVGATIGVSLLASRIPARRAARKDPVSSLRYE